MVYFADLAEKAGLDVSVSNAGTEPDAMIAPKVAEFLKNEGYTVPDFVPPLLTEEGLKSADLVVSLDCISADAVPPNTLYEDWSNVPPPSKGIQLSRDKIYAHVQQLVVEIAAIQSHNIAS